MMVVPLRRLGRSLGCEKIYLKMGMMQMQFVSNPDSPFYRSKAFSGVFEFVGAHPRRCQFKEVAGRNILQMAQVTTVGEAVDILRQMKDAKP